LPIHVAGQRLFRRLVKQARYFTAVRGNELFALHCRHLQLVFAGRQLLPKHLARVVGFPGRLARRSALRDVSFAQRSLGTQQLFLDALELGLGDGEGVVAFADGGLQLGLSASPRCMALGLVFGFALQPLHRFLQLVDLESLLQGLFFELPHVGFLGVDRHAEGFSPLLHPF
jgi:hypothetical protein